MAKSKFKIPKVEEEIGTFPVQPSDEQSEKVPTLRTSKGFEFGTSIRLESEVRTAKFETPPVIYPLLRAFSTFQGTIDGTQFRVFPRYVTGNQTLPQGGFGKVWTFAEVYQNGEKQQGENFTNLTDIQVKELRRVGMIQ